MFFSTDKSSGKGFKQELAEKLNSLFEKVQLILDMRKPLMVNIKIFPDKTTLEDAYFKIFNKRASLRAWYIYEDNTIYMNADDVFAGMLAHECAHAIADNFMTVKPPRATAEILARYVNAHLFKEAKTY